MSVSKEKLQAVLETTEDISELAPIVIVEIQSGDVKLVDLVEILGPWLTDQDKERRKNGNRLLVEVLRLLPHDFLNDSECQLLTDFFCDRLKDHYSIVPVALAGLSVVTSMENLPDDSPSDILIALQQNVTCQALTVSHRYSFYSIFHNIFTRKKQKVLSSSPSDFLFGLISGMDSESDPRNLLYLFSFLPSILSELPLKHLAEETFTVLECYFPVDFNPIENNSITREDLATSLEACLASSPEFAEFCLPMICEKLESSLKVAQMDALKLLISGLRCWNVESVSNHIETTWLAIKAVLLPGPDPDVSILAAQAIVTLLTAFSKAVLGEKETKSFTYLLESISSSTHGFLSDPSLSLFVPTLKLLSAVTSISSITADYFIPRVVPQLVALLESNCCNKDTVLKAFRPLLDSSVSHDSWESEGCRLHLEKVLPVLVALLDNPACRGGCFSCLFAIVTKIDDTSRNSLCYYVKKMVSIETSKVVREECAKFVTKLSEEYPQEVENIFLVSFTIPDDFDSDKCRRQLELLTWVADASPLTPKAAKIILNFVTNPENARWRYDAVSVLREYICERGSEDVLKRLGSKECDYPLSLVRSYLDNANCKEGEVAAVACFLPRIIRSLPSEEQEPILLAGLDVFNRKICADVTPATELVLLEGLASGLKPSVQIENSLELCENLILFSLTSDAEEARLSAARLLAVLINKSVDGDELKTVLNMAYKELSAKSDAPQSVQLCAWITKALVLRGHEDYSIWLDQLIKFTASDKLGMEGAEGVRLILEESSVLSSANYCTIGLLYKQRVFEKIDLLIPSESKPSKPSSLALAYILKNSPASLVLGRLDKLVGVMVHCLDDGDSVVSSAMLEILSSLLKSNVSDLGSLAQNFIPRCLQVAKNSPSMVVRKEALECIYLYAGYKVEDIMPYKKMVVNELQKCLDDKKRLVRQSAVRARTRWFVV